MALWPSAGLGGMKILLDRLGSVYIIECQSVYAQNVGVAAGMAQLVVRYAWTFLRSLLVYFGEQALK
jgi:hypothetical protein